MKNSLLFIFTFPPHQTIRAQESLDALLMGSAFSDCLALFLDQGVLQLVRSQDTSLTGHKDFSRTFGALPDYGVKRLLCSRSALTKYGLTTGDLVLEAESVTDDDVRALLANHNRVLCF